jgi:hypothetical protein
MDHMRRAASFLFVALAASPFAHAGHCYGRLSEGGNPVQGAQVTLTCGSEVVRGRTDGSGIYRVFAKTTGACTLQVDGSGWSATATLNSYDSPASNDFNVVRQGSNVALVKG